jgi:hypothetical protein
MGRKIRTRFPLVQHGNEEPGHAGLGLDELISRFLRDQFARDGVDHGGLAVADGHALPQRAVFGPQLFESRHCRISLKPE